MIIPWHKVLIIYKTYRLVIAITYSIEVPSITRFKRGVATFYFNASFNMPLHYTSGRFQSQAFFRYFFSIFSIFLLFFLKQQKRGQNRPLFILFLVIYNVHIACFSSFFLIFDNMKLLFA